VTGSASTDSPGTARREQAPTLPRHLGDFTFNARVLPITGLALVVGAAGAGAAYCLLRLIGLITNLVFYQRISTALVAPACRTSRWSRTSTISASAPGWCAAYSTTPGSLSGARIP
jgi:hypothetical protein